MTAMQVLVRRPDVPGPSERAPLGWPSGRLGPARLEIALAALGFAALCAVVLAKAPRMLEPDDYAYQASIVALTQGHLLLTTSQYHALSRQLGDGGSGIVQWVHLPGGDWISQKNPGYPFAAVVFQLLGILRLAPLFYGALACASLFVGARRWLGRYGGTAAVVLFCGSGAAITFAWRATMPSFTDASLVATGAGLLLWTLLATEAPGRRRLFAGLAAFVALEAATAIRYTDVVELAVAVVAVLLFARRSQLSLRTVGWWLATAAVFAAAVLTFDALVYGGPLQTGYLDVHITFSLSALVPNLAHMPGQLLAAMPMVVLAAVAGVWIVGRVLLDAITGGRVAAGNGRDAMVALVLLAGWLTIWGLYLTYTWTVGQFGADPVHVVRFYLPAVGLIALLGAWLLVRVPPLVALAAALGLLGLGILSFHAMAGAAAGGPGLGPGGSGGRSSPPVGRGGTGLPPRGPGGIRRLPRGPS